MSPEEKAEKAQESAEGAKKPRKEGTDRGSAGLQARRLVRSANKVAQDSDGAPTPQTEFLMSQANVLALLELADAVRSDKQT